MSQKSLQILHEGIRNQKAGFRSRAAKLYSQVPKGDQYHADALNLLGTIQFEEGRHIEAATLIEQAVRISPGNSAAWANLGGVAKEMGRKDVAVPCYRRAIMLSPNRHDGVVGLSLTDVGIGRAYALRRRLFIAPLDADGYIEIGNDLSALEHKEEGIARFKRAQIINPASPPAIFNRGNGLRDLNDLDSAQREYSKALAINPHNPNVLNNRGLISFSRRDWADAEAFFTRATKAYAAHAPSWFNMARCRQKLERPDETEAPYKRGLLVDPLNVQANCELAGQLDEVRWAHAARMINPFTQEPYNRLALLSTKNPGRVGVMENLRRGACVRPNDPDAWYNIGVEHGRNGLPHLASQYGWYATRIRDSHALAYLNTALALLVQERFEEGWEVHRRRLESPDALPFVRHFDIPEWIDEDLDGKKLLIWGEQGIGDEIQFLGVVKHLMRRGAHLTVLTEPRIRPILRRSIPEIDVPDVEAPNGKVEDHHGCDYQIALGDVPHRLKLFCGGIEGPEPWIVPDADRVAELRAGLEKRHPGEKLVGITWRSVAPKTGERRTIPIGMWRDIAATPGAAIISLQYGVKQEDLTGFEKDAGYPIDHSHGVEPILDLDGLAALVAAVDLVLCPANNTVHFAGAMGKECWTLLPTRPDWRWGLTREDSLWYPNTRVFRQPEDDAWEPVMANVASELKKWVAAG